MYSCRTHCDGNVGKVGKISVLTRRDALCSIVDIMKLLCKYKIARQRSASVIQEPTCAHAPAIAHCSFMYGVSRYRFDTILRNLGPGSIAARVEVPWRTHGDAKVRLELEMMLLCAPFWFGVTNQ
jgi:hypothetical protein